MRTMREMNESTSNRKTGNFKLGAVVVGVIIFLFAMILPLFVQKIPNGYVGVVYSPNGGVQEKTLGQGWHIVGLFDKVTKYPIRMQTVNYKDIKVATSDGKSVTIDFAYNYNVQPDKVVDVFNKFGPVDIEQIEKSYLKTRLWDAGRKAIAKYSVIDTYGERSSEAALDVQKLFSEDVGKLGFVVDNLTLGVPKPDGKTQAAIDKRVEAAQELERKQTELKIAEAEAKKINIEAQGKADAKVKEAKGQAEANRLLEKSITPGLIEMKNAEARMKHGWVTIQGGATPLIDVKK